MAAILAYLFYFIVSSASTLQRRWIAREKALDAKGQILFALSVNLIPSLISLGLPIFVPLQVSENYRLLIGLALTCGVFGSGFYIASYIAQKHVEAGTTTLLGNIYTPVTIVLSSVMLGEGLKPLQILGTIILLGAMVVVGDKHRLGSLKFDRYFWIMIASGIMLGVVLTAERALQKETGFALAAMLSWWPQCLFLGIAAIATNAKNNYSFKDIIYTGGLRAVQMFSWVFLIFTVGNLSLVSAITTFKIVVVFIMAAVFLHERDHLVKKIIGSLIAVTGLLLMR